MCANADVKWPQVALVCASQGPINTRMGSPLSPEAASPGAGSQPVIFHNALVVLLGECDLWRPARLS